MMQVDTTGEIIALTAKLDPGPYSGSWNHWSHQSENKSVLPYSVFVGRGHNLTKDVFADSRREGLGGIWIATCTYVYLCIYVIYFYMLLCKQFSSIHYLFPMQWHTHTQSLFQSPPPFSFFSQRFSPGNPLDLPLLSPVVKCAAV